MPKVTRDNTAYLWEKFMNSALKGGSGNHHTPVELAEKVDRLVKNYFERFGPEGGENKP